MYSFGNVHCCLKVWGQQDFLNTFSHQGHIKLIKSDSKDMYNVAKDFLFQIILFFF